MAEANDTKVDGEAGVQSEPVATWTGGDRIVGTIGIILMLTYLMIFSFVLLYGLIRLWPPASDASAEVAVESTPVFAIIPMGADARMLLLVAVAGALGSQIHVLRSFFWYVGNRTLKVSWLFMYILKPGIGATLSVLFYLVIRGGFFSTQAGVSDLSVFGFAALAGIVGMFSEQAVLKLKEVSETLLTPAEQGKDSEPAKEGSETPPAESEQVKSSPSP